MEGNQPGKRWTTPALAFACLAALAAHCARPQSPDLDREPGLAQPLRLGRWHSDQLYCRQADCADWFRIQLNAPGELRIEVKTATRAGPVPDLSLSLGDDRAFVLREASNRHSARAGLRWKATKAGPYFVSVASLNLDKQPLLYQLRASFRPRHTPPPTVSQPPAEPVPEPSPLEPEPIEFETVSSRVIELEGELGRTQIVLFVSDRARDLRRGLRGRLVEDGQTIGEVEVINVYNDGGVRARIDGILTGTVTSSTRVEIAVPVSEGAGHLRGEGRP